MIIKKYNTAAIVENPDLYDQLLQVVNSRYSTARQTLDYGLGFSKDVYTAWDEDHCYAFCMTDYKLLTPDHAEPVWSLYMGLAVRKADIRYQTSIFRLIKEIHNDGRIFNMNNSTNMPVWATTSSPAVFSLFHSAFADSEPGLNGIYSSKTEHLVAAIKNQFYNDKQFHDPHPYILRGISPTMYSAEEHERVMNMSKNRGYQLFSKLKISDKAGDRLIMVGWL